MAFSIETRLPFLDFRLVEYLLALPADFKIHNGITKWIFRKAMSNTLPKEILERTDKIGFAAPETKWINDARSHPVEAIVNNPHPLLGRYINIEAVDQLLGSADALGSEVSRDLARIVSLDAWLRAFFPNHAC